jgi:hypothetical protein
MNNHCRYGLDFKHKKGYAVKLGKRFFNHSFGGTEWLVIDKNKSFEGPSLLLTLDLNDPYLKKLGNDKISLLPLCSYLNCNIWEEEQIFQIFPDKHEVHLLSKTITNPEPCIGEAKLPNPLPKREVHLQELAIKDYPINENSYWKACDDLLGGNEFIRILQPIWLQNFEKHNCLCGQEMIFIACIGYENHLIKNGFLGDIPFFLGESALYFFFCDKCLIVRSTCQPS